MNPLKGLPQEGQQVFVVAPTGRTFSARVKALDAQSTLLALDGGLTDAADELSGGHVSIQYTNRRGVCRLDGQAHKEPEPGVLRVDHTNKVVLIQRREFVRVDALVPVTYEPCAAGGWTGETTTVNVSGGGFMVSGREGLQMGTSLNFTIELLDGDMRDSGPLSGTGRVVRETKAGLGIRIERIEERERERLIRWVFARERFGRQVVGRFS